MSELLRHDVPVVRRVPQLARFRARCAALTEQDLTTPQDLHRWSVEHFRDFWGEFLLWADLVWDRGRRRSASATTWRPRGSSPRCG